MVRSGKMPEASWLPYLALGGVGVFSAAFHATLWVETQRCKTLSPTSFSTYKQAMASPCSSRQQPRFTE
jgi:hypothetical protein